MTKICKKCKIEKELDLNNFYSRKEKVKNKIYERFDKKCKECVKEKQRDRNKRIKEENPNLYKKEKEEKRKYYKLYYPENKEQIALKNKEYYKNNREKNKERKKQYHKEYNKRPDTIQRVRKYKRDRYSKDINYKLSNILRSRFHSLLRTKDTKTDSYLDFLGCSIDELKSHLESKFQTEMSWENHGFGDDKWHVDHIIPCAAFDFTKEENQLKCFHYSNLQPLWAQDNMTKSDILPNGQKARYS